MKAEKINASFLNTLFEKGISYFENWTTRKSFIWYFPLVLFLLVNFFSFAGYEDFFSSDFKDDKWDFIFQQVHQPLKNHTDGIEGSLHIAKRAFRLSIPVIAYIFHLSNRFQIYTLQLICWYFFVVITFLLIKKLIKDNTASLMVIVSLAFTYIGYQGVGDLDGLFDSFAIFFLLCAMYFNNFFLVLIFCLLANFTDERAFLATSMVGIWWSYSEQKEGAGSSFKFALNQVSTNAIAVLLAGIIYLIIRKYLTMVYHFNAHSDAFFLGQFFGRFPTDFFGLWGCFEGLWLLVIPLLMYLFINKRWLLLALISFSGGVNLLAAFFVADITRSMTYLFPMFLVLIKYLPQLIGSKQELRKLTFIALLICFLYPTYNCQGSNKILRNSPLPIRLFKILNLK